MKKLCLFILFIQLLSSQTTMKVTTIYEDTVRAYKADSTHHLSRERFHRPTRFDSSVVFLKPISNGSYTYTFPSATGTFALTTTGGSVGNADSLGGLPAASWLKWSDTTIVSSKEWSNGRFLLFTDTTNKWAPKGIYLFPGDTTTFRTFSNLKYLKNDDSTLIRAYSNALYKSIGSSNVDSLGGVPASDYARLSVANVFTLRNSFPSVATDTVLGKTATKVLFPDTAFFGVQSGLNNELINVASNTDADIKAWTASTSDHSSLNMYRSRGTIATPSNISAGDNVAQFRGFGMYSGSFSEIANFTIGDHNKSTPSGFFSLKVKSENVASMTTDTSAIIVFPYMEYGNKQNYGVWLGSKTTAMGTIPAGVTVNATFNVKWASSFDSIVAFTRGFSVGGTLMVDANRNITNGGAITATGIMMLGAGGTAQAHQISSNSANALTLYRQITSVGAASGLNFAGNTSNGTQVTYGTIQGLLQSPSNSLQSGGLVFATRKSGVEQKAVMIDSVQNVFLQTQNTSTLTDTRFVIRSNVTGLYSLAVIPSASTTKQFALDTVGIVRNIGGIATSGAFGLAPIVDTVNYSAVASSIASKNLTSSAGTYRISYNLFTRTAGTGGTAQMTLSFNNGNAQTMTSAAINLNSANSMDDDVFVYTVASGTPTVSVTVTGATGSPTYTFKANVERLQ